MRYGWLGVGLMCLVALGGPAGPSAHAQDPAETGAAQSETTTRKVQVKQADQLFYDASTRIYHLTGNIVMVHEDMTLYSDKCDYDDRNNQAVATGNLKMVDPESTLTGDRVEAFFDDRLLRVSGNVTIVTQRRREEGTAPAGEEEEGLGQYREKKTTITCPELEYYYAEDRKQASLKGPLKAVQEDKTVYADQASYDGVKEEVLLEGNVRVVTENGSEFRAPRAHISLAEDWIRAENITGFAITEEKEEKPPESPPPAGSPEG